MADGWASSCDFRIEGLEELERDLTKVVKRCPAQARETLKDLGNDFKKSAKKRAKADLKSHKRKEGQEKKAISKKWGSKVVDESVGMTALVYNSARHFHLVELGHQLIKNGQVVGFVEGKHIMKKTREQYENIVPERFEEMIDDILKGCNL